MASYAALVSLMNLVEQIQKHPRPPITLNSEQVQSLTVKVAFLQDFLEAYNAYDGDKEVDRLRSRIADAAYAAEDVIESHVVDQIRAQSTSHGGENSCPVDFYQGLQKVIEGMDFIEKEVMEIKGKIKTQGQLLQKIITTPVVSSVSPATEKNTMVGFDDVLLKMLHKLTGSPESRLQISSISGMGGIGKTTLARNVYTNQRIKDHFDVLTWVTISQDYNIREILLCLQNKGIAESSSGKSEQDLGLELHKSLYGRRYLIVMDDMWSVEAWDNVKNSFPDNNNGSRIVITTRMSKLAKDLDSNGLEMSLLNEDESWDLFCKTGFGEHGCPDELEQIAKRIANNCKGLPLSLVVIGGLVAKSKLTRENLEYLAENLNSVVNLDDNERCLKILSTSYNQLPIYLKPCFLYMGSLPKVEFFQGNVQIRISELIMQLIGEGFLKPNKAKSLEETAEEYLTDLMEINLILGRIFGRCGSGKPYCCTIHDLLRDLCLREAQKEKFFYVTSQQSLDIIPREISTQRRVVILESTSKEDTPFPEFRLLSRHHECIFKSASRVRSLIRHFDGPLPLPDFKLLRLLKVFECEKENSIEHIDQLINARYLGLGPKFSSNYQPWNLQILNFEFSHTTISNFWMIPLLRHVKFERLCIPDPGNGQMDKQDGFVLENLQTLSNLSDFKLSEEVVKRIPNIKDLKVHYDNVEGFDVASHYCLNNFVLLHKLESLYCSFRLQVEFDFLNNMSFPNSLKELSLEGCILDWEDMNIKIGSLPFLQRLFLGVSNFRSSKWETREGRFTSLKYLRIASSNLECWTTESTHFPCLESLVLQNLKAFKEIPSDIGEIPTLKSIKVEHSTDSAVMSAKQILDEQEEDGNEILVEVKLSPSSGVVREILSGRNQVQAMSNMNMNELSYEKKMKELSKELSSGNFHVFWSWDSWDWDWGAPHCPPSRVPTMHQPPAVPSSPVPILAANRSSPSSRHSK